MKTAKEILDSNILDLDGKPRKDSLVYFYEESIIKAMQEYAQQVFNDVEKEAFYYVNEAEKDFLSTELSYIKSKYDLT